MFLKYIFSITLMANAIIAFALCLRIILSYEKRFTDNKILALFSVFSGIWSLGFGLLFIQTNQKNAYYCRSFGIIGTIGFMITAQMLTISIAKLSRKKKILFNGLALTGIPLYFFAIQKYTTIYVMTSFGMTYEFTSGIINTFYSLYFLVVSFNIWLVIMYMIYRSTFKRIKYFGKKFLIVMILVLIGTVLDVVFPLLGFPALPGSNVTQFWALIIIWVAMLKINASRVNIKNMSQYVYFSLGNAVLVLDSEMEIKIVNDAAADFLGLERLLPNSTRGYEERTEEFFDIQGGDLFTFEGDHKSIDTTCIKNDVRCNLKISKIKDEYGDLIGYIIVVTDLTERMRYMKSLEEAKKEADYANQAKSVFLANMSHEIRTPMNAIMGFAELALKKKVDDELKEYLIDIKQSSEGLLGIINDILNITKIESGKLEIINTEYELSNLLKPVYQMTKQLAEKKKLEYRVHISDNLPRTLYGDELRIREILINLINNAIKYTEEGEVSLFVELLDTYEKTAKIRFAVKDSGIGIREEDIPFLFDSFQRVDEERNRHIEGTGLGLSIVKGYIDLMGGTIEVESEYGQGSCFIVTLEQIVINSDTISNEEIFGLKETESSNLGKLTFNGENVLVVDDNEVNLKVMEKTLEGYGLTVDTVSSGPDAIRLCSIKKFPLIFMDQMMPEMNGEETLLAIRESVQYYKTEGKIVMLTANAFEKVKEEAISIGFDDYLKKPLEYKELERVLKEYIGNHSEKILETQTDSETENKELVENKLLNISKGIEHCAGSESIYNSVLKVAIKNESSDIEKLMIAYKEKDYKQIGIQAHAMKGSCLNIGAEYTGELARKLEFAGKEEDTEYIENNLEPFVEEYKRLIKEIIKYVEKNN